MRTFIITFTVATVASALLTPLVRLLALKLGAVSNPGGRNVNERTVPRLGGLAIVVACLVPLGALFAVDSTIAIAMRADRVRVLGLVVGGLAMCGVGALDDTRRVRALHKLLVQVGAAVLAYACGFRIEAIDLPLGGALQMGIFALPVTIIWIVGITNAINLIDGLDGLAGGVVFFAGVTNFVVAYLTGSTFVATIMAATTGAVLGFLFFNFNPARIFMGDSGSYFLGFVLGAISLGGSSQKASTAVSLLVPILALGLPIVDTLFSMLRRILERRSVFSPDRGHIHHRLLEMGFTHRRAVLVLYGVSIVFTVAAVGVSLNRSWSVGVAILAASVVLIGIVRFVGFFEYLFIIRRQKARLRSRDAELLRGLLPDVPALFAAARTEREIWSALRESIIRADITVVELVTADSTVVVERWRKGETNDSALAIADLVSAKFPLGREDLARAQLRFRWRSDQGDVSAQSEVLLQVIVDVVTRNLTRVGSEYAPLEPEATPGVTRVSDGNQPVRAE